MTGKTGETIYVERGWRGLPVWVGLVSVSALLVPVGLAFAARWQAVGWLAALVPVFLLTYYRRAPGAAVAMTASIAALLATQWLASGRDSGEPIWSLQSGAGAAYVLVSLGIAALGELLHRRRRAAEAAALVDALTQLPNRRHAELALEREFAAALRGRKVGVVVYDVDHFKQFNDRFGHAAGDEVLKLFADVLRYYTRRQNLSARYGGEEFITVVSDVELEGLLIFANRVREGIKAKEHRWGQITISAGAAVLQEGMGSHHALVAAADRALYRAKEAGRDRVEAARDEPRRSRSSVSLRGDFKRPHRVLLVEDEAESRRVLAEALERVGYETLDTGSPEEATHLLRAGTAHFDVVVTGVRMPRVSGYAPLDQLTPSGGEVMVVYIGGSDHGAPTRGGSGDVTRFLSRPVSPEGLLKAVTDVMAAGSGERK